MDSQNIIQPKRSTILHIRSKDATQLTTGYNTNFDINLTNAIIINENEEIHISIMSAEIPYSFYNVSTELENNKLVYDDTNTLTFTSQDYDIDELVEFFEANTAFKAIFTTTYNTQTNKISFKNTTGVTHKINLSLSNVNKEIGFSESDTDRTITAGSTLTSDFVCNLATVHSIFIKSSLSTANVLSTRAGNSTTLQKISVDTNSLGIIYMNSGDFRQVTVSQVPVIDHITFSITDQNNRLLQLNNVNYEFSILFEIYPKYNQINNQSRNIISNRRTVNIPTQPQNIVRLPTNLVIDELDNTHPIENKSEVKHKTDRIVLDNLLDIVSDQ
tara:strand:+ start:232 stop:1221 length:990 start_codon:yes stop_codon:yes gene_type:complete